MEEGLRRHAHASGVTEPGFEFTSSRQGNSPQLFPWRGPRGGDEVAYIIPDGADDTRLRRAATVKCGVAVVGVVANSSGL